MSSPEKTNKPNRESIQAVIQRKRREMQTRNSTQADGPGRSDFVKDPYANATAAIKLVRGKTGVVYNNEMLLHKCEWDSNHPECPNRLGETINRCAELGLLEMCTRLPNTLRNDVDKKINLLHTKNIFDELKKFSQLSPRDDLESYENFARKYDSVYINEHTFNAACLAVSCTLNLVESVAKKEVTNGMAFVRPPGHHAMADECNGYCFFNNVAIAAKSILQDNLAKKILIVDVDVHHGQGTQRFFYDTNEVLYFSIHRYEYGTFWPNLKESSFNYIGKDKGLGYNVNVPLNATGMNDGDYLAIVLYVLLPIAYEFNPDLVIVSAGYDAAVGCPEGRMNVTPGFYGHLISLLSPLAEGKIAVVVEGGYCIPTMAEAASQTLKALIGMPCPLLEPIRDLQPTVIDSICNIRRYLHSLWKCFDVCELEDSSEDPREKHICKIEYYGEVDTAPFPTRQAYPIVKKVDSKYVEKFNLALREKYNAVTETSVRYVYEPQMLLHSPPAGEKERPEKPARLESIMSAFHQFGVDTRLEKQTVTQRNFDAYNPHNPEYIKELCQGSIESSGDIYTNENTMTAVNTAVSGLLAVGEAVADGKCRSGIAVIRPPGHHAERNEAMGFCFLNNAALLANFYITEKKIERILIIDFDIHHGNGTQNIFYQSEKVLYISIHKDEDGTYFPKSSQRSYKCDGYGRGKGYNMNIPLNKDRMGDTEYLSIFMNIVLPAAYAYAPEIVIVSAGFDAGISDPLGTYTVSPETFGHFIMLLKSLANGKLVLTLEGGYNLTTTSYAMALCAKALLGDPVTMPDNLFASISGEAIKTIRSVQQNFEKYYGIFKTNRVLGATPIVYKKIDQWSLDSHQLQLTTAVDAEKLYDTEYIEKQMD